MNLDAVRYDWRSRWQELKLRALDYRFYGKQPWVTSAVGDLYCTMQFGAGLYLISEISSNQVTTHTLFNNQCEEHTVKDTKRDYTEFMSGKFAAVNLLVPPWLWDQACELLTMDDAEPVLSS